MIVTRSAEQTDCYQRRPSISISLPHGWHGFYRVSTHQGSKDICAKSGLRGRYDSGWWALDLPLGGWTGG